MRIASIIPCLILLSGCSSQPAGKDTIDAPETAEDNRPQLTVKDSSLYDLTFLNGLKVYRGHIELVSNYIIVDGDSVSFPIDIPQETTETFYGQLDARKFKLIVGIENLTTLSYQFSMTDLNDKVIEQLEGKAVLTPMFFLGSEVDEDSETKEGYMAAEYWDTKGLSIRIGERDNQNRLRAKVQHSTLKLDECPTLRAR